jgi:hypothetical protein
MKFVNAQQAKEIVPVKKKKKRLYNTNTWWLFCTAALPDEGPFRPKTCTSFVN